MFLPCLSKRKQQHRQSFIGDELHAFDLTWRNYIPSASQFCCCFENRGIQLEDDDPLVDLPYFNDQTLHRGNHLDGPRDWEFESVLDQNDLPQFVTRNPFGTSSLKKKKKKKRSEGSAVASYNIRDQQQEDNYCNDDAEFLGNDQIANLAYNRHSNQVMDQYGEELYQDYVQGSIEQEMQAPPREFYAARTIPNISYDHQQGNNKDYQEILDPAQFASSSQQQQSNPFMPDLAAQTLLNDKLDDLTEKLVSIKKNIMHIRPQSQHENDQEFDSRTTLHTLHHEGPEESHSISDLDSVASEALHVYENTTNIDMNNHSYAHSAIARRYSLGDELHIPSLVDNNTLFESEQHPFSYFTNHSSSPSHQADTIVDTQDQAQAPNLDGDTGINVDSVFKMGRRWLGV